MKINLKSQIPGPKLITVVLVLLCLMPVFLTANPSYPLPEEKYVNDFAATLTRTDRETLSAMLNKLETGAGIEMKVVTVKSVTDYTAGEPDVGAFAANLFNAWGMQKDKGVLMLVAVKDRKMKIELGGGYGEEYESIMKQLIDKKMLPYFKEGNYSRGIYEGVRALIFKVTRKPSVFELYWPYFAAGLGIIALLVFVVMRGGKSGALKQKKEKQKKPVVEPFGSGAWGEW